MAFTPVKERVWNFEDMITSGTEYRTGQNRSDSP